MGHLIGARPTEVGSGLVTGTMPGSPALQSYDGSVDILVCTQIVLELAAVPAVPARVDVRCAGLAGNHHRPSRVESEAVVLRARTR